MRAFGYARVSTSRQADEMKTSLDEQQKRIKKWVAGQMEEPELRMFVERGVGGGIPLNERPQGIAMLTEVGRGDVIVAAKMTRLFRSTSDALVSVEDFQRQGIGVVLLDIGPDPIGGNAVGKMCFTIMAACAEFDKMRILEQMNEGRTAKLAKGGFVGGHAPYGFRIVGRGSHAILAEDADEQETIKAVKALREQQLSLRAISRRLETEGISNREGGKFHSEQIRRMLANNQTQMAAE